AGAARAVPARPARAPRPALAESGRVRDPARADAGARGRPRRALLPEVPAERHEPAVLEPAGLGVGRAGAGHGRAGAARAPRRRGRRAPPGSAWLGAARGADGRAGGGDALPLFPPAP